MNNYLWFLKCILLMVKDFKKMENRYKFYKKKLNNFHKLKKRKNNI